MRGSDFLSQKKNVVVFAHRLIERKNPWIAVKAFAFLAKKHSDWSFEVYGNGPLSGEIELYCSAAGLDNLNYLGYHDDIPCVLARSKIFVSLIYPDNFPSQSVFEAMACGNALVISDTGDSCERFLCGDNGVSVELDVDSLIKGVEKLIVSEDLAFKNKESIRFFEKHYSEQDYVNESLEIYRSLDFY